MNWASALNWSGNVAPIAGDALVFAGASNTPPLNNFPANTLFGGLAFGTTAAAFNLVGNAINLGGDIVDDSLNAQTIAINLSLTAVQSVHVSSIDGSLTISGVIFGAPVGLNKTGSGLLTLNGANTFSGPVTVSGGTLAIAADSTAAPNPLGFGAAGPGTLTLDGGALRSTASTQLSMNRSVLLGHAGGGGGTLVLGGVSTTLGNANATGLGDECRQSDAEHDEQE